MKPALILGCLLLSSQALFGQPAATSSIEGQVVNQITGAPIPRVALSLRLTSTGQAARPGAPPRDINATREAESDAQGRFAFHNLEAGGYQITAQRQGFLNTRVGIGGVSLNPAPSQLFLGEAQQLTGYLVRLTPQSVVAGQVVDADGDPVAGCQVRALRWGYSNGVRQLMPYLVSGMMPTTDDLGKYRLAGLPPGSYYVEATPRNQNQNRMPVYPQQPLPDQPQLIYATTYHPSATEASAATAIRVAEGVEVTGIDIKLARTRAFSIRGQVVDPDAAPGRLGFASLRPRNAAAAGSFMGYSSSSMDGTFVISGVPPGSYDLVSQRMNNGASTGPAATAVLPIEVRDRNLDGITVTLLPSFDVQGVVKFAQAAQCGSYGMTVSLSPAGGVYYSAMPQQVQVGADSKFTLKNVGPSPYTVNVINAGSCYVQSVRFGGKEVADSGVSMDAAGALEITAAASSATVQVSVVDAAGKTPPRAFVTLLRKGGPPSSFRQAMLSPGGLTFTNLPPGTYDVFAWEQLDMNAARSPDFLKQFEGRGKAVTIGASGRSTLQLTAIPASETMDPASPLPAEPPRAKGSLEGRVVPAVAGAPLRNVSVVLRNMSAPLAATFNGMRENVAAADAEGRFAFPDLEPGNYMISARRQGFGEGGATGAGSLIGESLIVGEGQRIADYTLRLSSRSVISGKVVDEAGDPVSRVRVAIYRYVYSQERRRLVPAGPGAPTDDLGQYRIANLAPGNYYLSATRGNDSVAPGVLSSTLSSGDVTMPAVAGRPLRLVETLPPPVAGEAEMGYAPVWYPTAPGPEAASAVVVKAGSGAASIDFTLHRSRMWSVRGQIVDPAADPARPPMIALSPKGSTLTIPVGRSSTQARDGGFEISGVPPGSYVLTTRAMGGQQTRMALRTIEVKDAPIDGVRLEMGSGRVLKGSLKVEGGGTFSPGFLMFSSPEGGMAHAMSQTNDGSLTIQNVFPSVYSLELPSLTGSLYGNCYVKSVRYGGREFPAGAIDFSGEGQLDIVLSAKAATLEGSVLDQQGHPAAHAAIALAPAGEGEPLRTGTADARGAFYFAGLPPGDYRIFAWDAAAPEASDPPPSLAPFESASKAVKLAESAREKVQVTAMAPK